MATYYSSFYASSAAESTASGAIASSNSNYSYSGPSFEKSGDVRSFNGTVTIATNLATADIIKLFDVPVGFKLSHMTVEWGDLDGGTALDMDLGLITQNPDAYLNGGSAFQSADTTIASGEGSNILTEFSTEIVFDEPVTTARDVVGFTVITGATSLAATRTITFSATGYLK